jgi:hypothetical protein
MSLKRLLPYLATKGITVVWHKRYPKKEGISHAPFTSGLGIDRQKMEIHAVNNTPWGHLLHEAGHLLWGMKDDISFIGWELDVCFTHRMSMKALRGSFHDYAVYWGVFDTVEDLDRNPRAWRKFRDEKIQESREKGMLV